VQAAVRVFLNQGGGGSIVSVGPVAGVTAAPLRAGRVRSGHDRAGYGAAMTGPAGVARTVAAEYAADGIRMNVVTCDV
jgi:3-oxoacyl-[acyl-carrier protein] reductase